MIWLAKRRYPPGFDIEASEMWVRNIVLKSPLMFYPVRTDDAFVIAMLSTTPWFPSDFECNITMVCADLNAGWQPLVLLKATIEWAKRRKCATWRLVSETDYDLTPFARRLGAEEITPRFRIKLDG